MHSQSEATIHAQALATSIKQTWAPPMWVRTPRNTLYYLRPKMSPNTRGNIISKYYEYSHDDVQICGIIKYHLL